MAQARRDCGAIMAKERLGFIGLGVMGHWMAHNLLRHAPLVVFNRTASRAEELKRQGAVVVQSPREVAQRSDIIFLMLSDDEAVSQVVLGDFGVVSGVSAGCIVVDHSTISPKTTLKLAEHVAQRGAHWIDAPVTGGDVGAREARLTIMVGGQEDDVSRVRPYLSWVGQHIVRVGDVGQGQKLKLVANLVSAMNLMAASEGVQMGRHLGIPLATLREVMTHGSSESFELEKVFDRLERQDYHPGFSVKNRVKDLRLAIDLAQETRFPADLGRHAEGLYEDWLVEHEEADEASYIKRWEDE